MNNRVFFIIVCYEPDIRFLIENINRLVHDCCGGVVVDNSVATIANELEETIHSLGDNVRFINNEDNRGIAAAINQGIETALASTAEYLLIMDDDSTLVDGALARMIQTCSDLQSMGKQVAAVGPCFEDKVTMRSGVFPVFHGIRTERHRCSGTEGDWFRSEYIMSSGSLIPRNAIDKVGLMREELFIDLVDTEWCLRARSLEWYCYVVCDAKMHHRFGCRRLPMVNVPYRPPVRHYYIFRNSIHVFGLAYIPRAWELLQITYLIRLFLLLMVLPSDRFTQMKFLFKGILHGFSGKLGRIEGH